DNARPTMPIATRAKHLTQGHTNGRLRVARLHAQVQVNNGAAAVAVDHKPMVLGDQRRAYRRPKPGPALARHNRIEAAYGRQCPALRFPLTPHARDVVAYLIVACVVAHAEKLPRFWAETFLTYLKLPLPDGRRV